jgi:hypothetical protein
METLQINKQFKLNILTDYAFGIIQNPDLGLNAPNLRCDKSLKIELNRGKEIIARLVLTPLISKLGHENHRAIMFEYLNYSGLRAANFIIKEALMLSWEMGYEVAFANTDIPLFVKSGFEKVSKIFTCYNNQQPLFYSELTWNGMKNIPCDLVFPSNINLFKILT